MPLYVAFRLDGDEYEHDGSFQTLEKAIETYHLAKDKLKIRVDNVWVGITPAGEEITLVEVSQDKYQIYFGDASQSS